MACVCLQSVSKSYPVRRSRIQVLSAFSLAVENGELVTVVGPAGCGKTTLLRLIAGLERPDAGSVAIEGREVSDRPAADRDVAMVFQGYALYPQKSVRENLAFGLKMRGHARNEIAERIETLAELLHVGDLLERMPAELSGGEQQRVAMARALVRRPAVLLLDEPLSNLDAPSRLRVRAELAGLHRRLGVTMIHVTHDQEEAMTLGQRLVVMHHGAVQQIGPPIEVYRQPVNRFVAGFMGMPPMNFISDADRAGVVIGIRPQHISLNSEGLSSGLATLGRGIVEHIEELGDAAHVHLRLVTGETILARVPATHLPRLRDERAVCYHPADAHFFAPDGSRVSGISH